MLVCKTVSTLCVVALPQCASGWSPIAATRRQGKRCSTQAVCVVCRVSPTRLRGVCAATQGVFTRFAGGDASLDRTPAASNRAADATHSSARAAPQTRVRKRNVRRAAHSPRHARRSILRPNQAPRTDGVRPLAQLVCASWSARLWAPCALTRVSNSSSALPADAATPYSPACDALCVVCTQPRGGASTRWPARRQLWTWLSSAAATLGARLLLLPPGAARARCW